MHWSLSNYNDEVRWVELRIYIVPRPICLFVCLSVKQNVLFPYLFKIVTCTSTILLHVKVFDINLDLSVHLVTTLLKKMQMF